eukprot:2485568-Rhodomonas_salina.1
MCVPVTASSSRVRLRSSGADLAKVHKEVEMALRVSSNTAPRASSEKMHSLRALDLLEVHGVAEPATRLGVLA